MVLNTSETAGDDDGTDEARDATGGLGSWLDALRGAQERAKHSKQYR